MKFEDLNLSKELLETIKKLGFTSTTQIQEKSIIPIVEGKDVVGESATGSGKTLAFGCTIVENTKKHNGLQALILTPTRELAEQVKENIKDLSKSKHLNVITLYGGVSILRQIDNLPKAEVVIATPGRLLDHIQRGTINLSKIKILIMDEADRMFDMGFIGDVERIIQFCPEKRQTLFFSATITPNIKDLAKKYMTNPITILAENKVDPNKLTQFCYNIPQNMKLSLLIDLLKNEKSNLVMIFCNTRRSVDFVVKNLKKNGMNATAIHGGLSQNKRTKTMYMFHDSKREILVCTDVASRGLHIENVSHIYNYEIPLDPKDYIHRIGRTARVGEKGKVINFLSPRDYHNYDRILSEYNTFKIENLKKENFKKIIPVQRDIESPQGRDYQRGSQRSSYQGRHSQSGLQRRSYGDRGPQRSSYGGRPQQRSPYRDRTSQGRDSNRSSQSRPPQRTSQGRDSNRSSQSRPPQRSSQGRPQSRPPQRSSQGSSQRGPVKKKYSKRR